MLIAIAAYNLPRHLDLKDIQHAGTLDTCIRFIWETFIFIRLNLE